MTYTTVSVATASYSFAYVKLAVRPCFLYCIIKVQSECLWCTQGSVVYIGFWGVYRVLWCI